MSVVPTRKCDECGIQKSFANHWVMLIQRHDELAILPAWIEGKLQETLHLCGREHASRYIDRWLADHSDAFGKNAVTLSGLITATSDSHFPKVAQEWLEDEEAAESARASVRLRLDFKDSFVPLRYRHE